MPSVLLGLGANIGDRAATLEAAVEALEPWVDLAAVSRIYETAPMYVADQPAFLNMAACGSTVLSAASLLDAIKGLETHLGRVPSDRYGPRAVDIDILLYDDLVMAGPRLSIPHPRMAERPFVLVPAAEIAGDWTHPQIGASVAEMLAALGPTEAEVWPWIGEREKRAQLEQRT